MVKCQTRFCPGGPPSASHMAADQHVFTFAFCSHNSTSSNAIVGPIETRKLWFHSCHFIQAVCLGKNWRRKLQYLPTLANWQWQVCLLFLWSMGRGHQESCTYLCLDCAKNMDKNWNITVSFNIHMNFDHMWAEHYRVTLMPNNKIFLAVRVIRASTVL